MSASASTPSKPSKAIRRFLATVCSSLQYLDDRGELEDPKTRTLRGFITKVRYTNIDAIDHFDVVIGNRLVRISATDIGPVPEGFKGDYDEDETDLEFHETQDA